MQYLNLSTIRFTGALISGGDLSSLGTFQVLDLSYNELSGELIHMISCLHESAPTSARSSAVHVKVVTAAYNSSIFLKCLVENSKSDSFEELNLYLDEDQRIVNFVMHGVLNYIGTSDLSPHTYLLHHEPLNFLIVAFSTHPSSLSPGDVHPFIDAAMVQESALVSSVVRKLLLNYIARPRVPLNGALQPVFPGGKQSGVLQKVGSIAANFVLLPYYTFNYLVSSSGDGPRSPLADKSLLVLLVLLHYRKCVLMAEPRENNSANDADLTPHLTENSHFAVNPYYTDLENAGDIEFDRVDIEGNAHCGPLVRLTFASLFDALGMCLNDESSVLALYSLLHGNSDFREYVLVRTDSETLLQPILEMLYNASIPRRISSL
ncbi:uncharacterized protein [Aristolochia californica]|uniref:uncharacterized protein n=1 Tax=Aristolochia californica TaxID=171875 RepID=UPI0035DBE134